MSDLEEAWTLLKARVAELDARFNGRDGQPSRFCETGDCYETLCSGGLKEEGQPTQLYPSPGEAVTAWIGQTRIYNDPELVGTLYWRRRPTIDYVEERVQIRSRPDGKWGVPFISPERGWYARARLVITSNPVRGSEAA